MYYELYVDSLFLVNFVMNLYLLILVNQSTLRTATRKGMIGGACVGAVCYLLPFMIPLPGWAKYPMGLLAGTGLMIYITFHPVKLGGYCKILGCLLGYSFLLGGLLLFVKNTLPFVDRVFSGIGGVCGIGALGAMFIGYLWERRKGDQMRSSCNVTLICGDRMVRTQALIDSGNSLWEPISKKPVSVIDVEIYRELWGEEEVLFRAIPYHSIGKNKGIMRGYLLPCMEIEVDGVIKRVTDVYVAVSEEHSFVSVILNPALLMD